MTDRTKKILLIIAFILVTFIIGFVLYYVFFRPFIAPAPPVVTPPINAPVTGLPTIPPALNLPPLIPTINIPPGIRPEIPTIPPTAPIVGPEISFQARGGITSFETIVRTPSQSPVLATNGNDLIYYDGQMGFFYTVTPTGEKKLFTDQPFKNVSNAVWSPNRQKVILEYPDGSNLIYDLNQKKSVTLPAHWKDFVFSNDGKQIAFKDMKLDLENRYLAVADTNGGSYKPIEQIGDKDADVFVTWSPTNDYIAMYRESLDGDRSDVYPIGFNGENYQKLTVEGRDLRYVWAPSGNKLLYSAFNSVSNYNPTLWVVNSSPDLLGTGKNSLGIQTWADKCTFASENEIYCAVPESLPSGTGFLPDLASTTPDNFYKINVATGAKEVLAQPIFPTTVSKLIISEDGKTLYWLDKNTNLINKMDL